MLAEGVSPKVVQEILEHAKIETTLNLYARILPTMQREAMDPLNLLLAGEESPVSTLRVQIRDKSIKRV